MGRNRGRWRAKSRERAWELIAIALFAGLTAFALFWVPGESWRASGARRPSAGPAEPAGSDIRAADVRPDTATHRHHSPAPEPEPTVGRTDEGRSRTAAPSSPASAGERLIRRTAEHLSRWQDVAVAEADGYRSIGDASTGHEHLVHAGYALDERILDPSAPESLVYRVDGDRRELVSAMYVLPPGSTMADVPDLGDDRAVWHTHDDLCFDETGRVTGRSMDGRCVNGGVRVITPPMLHVWIVEHPCGPFAALDGHGGGCHRAAR